MPLNTVLRMHCHISLSDWVTTGLHYKYMIMRVLNVDA